MGSPQGAGRLLDPRWHWVQQAARKLYAELDGDARPVGLSLSVLTGSGEAMFYALTPGDETVIRRVFTDLDGLMANAEEFSVDAAPEDVTG